MSRARIATQVIWLQSSWPWPDLWLPLWHSIKAPALAYRGTTVYPQGLSTVYPLGRADRCAPLNLSLASPVPSCLLCLCLLLSPSPLCFPATLRSCAWQPLNSVSPALQTALAPFTSFQPWDLHFLLPPCRGLLGLATKVSSVFLYIFYMSILHRFWVLQVFSPRLGLSLSPSLT